MLYVVSYDVTDDDRRKRLHEFLKGYGTRVQYSVFECDLSEQEVEDVVRWVTAEIDEGEDSCRLYRFCESCRGEVKIVGVGDQYEEPEVIVI